MRRLALSIATFLSIAMPVYAEDPAAVMPTVQTRPATFSELARKLLPTVVNVSSTGQNTASDEDMLPPLKPPTTPDGASPFDNFYDQYSEQNLQQDAPLTESASLGSGFIIDAEKGLIITNNHVIQDSTDIRITMHDDSTYRAKIIGVDDKTDIALLKIDPQGHPLSQVEFGDSNTLEVGDWILAIGNPFGLGGTVTAGIVSARSRDINAGPYDDFIQTDASINRGNSGGPMFNTSGELIGINTAIFSPSGGSVGIGFAIPINMAKPVIRQLVTYGKTKRGWLGVKVQSVTPEIAESLGLKDGPEGALVATVTPGGPGENAGMQAYDILLSFGGKKIHTMRDLPRLVAEAEVGQSIPVQLFRDGKIIETSAVMGELEIAEANGTPDAPSATPLAQPNPTTPQQPSQAPTPAPAKPKVDLGMFYHGLGLTIAPISPALSDRYGLVEGMSGLVITRVEDYSDAARKGLLPGDVIREVNRTSVSAQQALAELLATARSEKRGAVLLLIDRAGDERFVAIKLEKLPAKKSAPSKPAS